MTLEPHQQRVVSEKAELDERILKLHAFIQESHIFRALPEDDQDRLKRQHVAMADYSGILGERIAAFGYQHRRVANR